ncbi:MAG: MgtC/SapB family protein, partial [Dehalococcoidia bacterium]
MDEAGVEAAASLAVALGIGLLLGAERERSQSRRGPRGSAGIRTFALVALLGAVADHVGGTPMVVVGFGLVGAATLLGYVRGDRQDLGLTSEVALLVAFLLGVLSQEEAALASAIAVTVTILLATRTALHRFVSSVLTDLEVHDALLFAAAAAVILPLMPDRTVGPLDTLNPFAVWRLVVLLMGISAAGYVATRALGPRF